MLPKTNALLLAIVLVYAASFRLLVLNRPFFYDAEGSGCLNGVLARNYLRFDWSQTHGIPVLSSVPDRAAPVVFYPDHPPMLPLLIAPFYAAFGVGAWQTRLPIALLTLLTIALLYTLLARTSTARAGLIAAALFAATPMTLYFGGFPDVVGMPLIASILLTVLAYVHFHRAPDSGTFTRLAGAFALAALCDWPAYVIVPVFVVCFISTHRRHEWSWMLAFAVGACALFVATYVYIMFAAQLPWNWMAPLFSRRSSLAGQTAFTFRQWLDAAGTFNRTYHTIPLLVAGAYWVGAFAFRRGDSQPGTIVARLLLGWAALYVLIGSKALYDHEWAWLPLTAGLVAAAALLIERALRTSERFGRGTIASWIVALCIVSFASWNGYATLTDLSAGASDPYTPSEMGAAIQEAAPDAGDVGLVFGGDASAQLWFYGDRRLRTNIWTIEDLQRRLDDDTVDLMFNFDDQPWHARATGFVFPKASERDFWRLKRYLTERYPLKPLPAALADKFDVFDLRHLQPHALTSK